MELRPGYKQSQLGIIPSDWNLRPLGEIANVSAGGTPRRDVPQYWNGDVPWVTTKEIDFCVIEETAERITKAGVENSAAKMLPPGTLLLALYGQGKTRGKVGILGIEAATNQACAAISLRQGISGSFVFHSLASRYDAIRKLSNTGNQDNLNSTLVRSIPIPLPDEQEQRTIATALSDMDALVDTLDRLIAKKRDLKQVAMHQLLNGQTRLPGFSGEWEVKRLGDVADVLKGSGLSRSALSASGKNPCILYGELFTMYGRVISSVVSRTDSVEGVLSKSGDVLMPGSTTTTGIDLATASALMIDGVLLGGDINIIRRNSSRLDPAFLANHLTLTKRQAIAEIAQGITIHHLYGRDLKALSLAIPPAAEQFAIATVLSDMGAEIEALAARRAKTLGLKQAMMQELLTGRARLI